MKSAYSIVSVIILVLSRYIAAVDGALDTTFNPEGEVPGIVSTLINLSYSYSSVIVQADGKVVAAAYSRGGGHNPNKLILTRYRSDGILDTTFGTSGVVVGPEANSFQDNFPPAIMIQPDGKIIVGFSTSSDVTAQAIVARYTTQGELDVLFGEGTGLVILPNSGEDPTTCCSYLVLQPDGKILCIGVQMAAGLSIINGYAVRLNNDGSIDSSFGSNGIYTHPIGEIPSPSIYYSGLLQQDGKLVIGGTGSDSIVTGLLIQRLLPTGIPDPDFGTQGTTITQIGNNDVITSLVLQPDGYIVASGISDGFDVVARYTPQGMLDTTFGSPQGYVIATMPVQFYSVCALQSDGKIMVSADNEPDTAFKVARYLSDGSLDITFGTDGIVTTTSLAVATASGLSIQPDGKLLVAGTVNYTDGIAIARYLIADTPLATAAITYPISGQTFATVPTFSGAAQNPSTMSVFINDTLNDADTVFTTSSYNQWSLTPTRGAIRTGVFPPGTYTYRGVSYYPNGRSQQKTDEGTFTIGSLFEPLSKVSLLSEKLLSKQCSETYPATSDLAVALHNKICDVPVE